MDADDLFLGLALDTGDLLQIQGIFAFVEDRDLGDNGLGEARQIQVLDALVNGPPSTGPDLR